MATADCLFSFAVTATQPGYCLPEIVSEPGTLNIVAGRHPMVETILPTPFVPNDISFSNGNAKQMILTGLLIFIHEHLGLNSPARHRYQYGRQKQFESSNRTHRTDGSGLLVICLNFDPKAELSVYRSDPMCLRLPVKHRFSTGSTQEWALATTSPVAARRSW
jgi:hypothetical protein